MKQLEYLSPSSISVYLSDPKQFYLIYLSDNRPDRVKQTQPMSVGSAFDAYIKAHLRHCLYGDNKDELFNQYFEDGVEEQNRDFASIAGMRVFNNYLASGACNDLLVELVKAKHGPLFEFYVNDSKGVEVSDHGVKFLGKPDLWYVSEGGKHVVLDWKVNGYCSKHNISPKKGYVIIRDGIAEKPSRGNGKPHREAILMNDSGVLIDTYFKMEDKDADWARQISIYSWLCGEEIGSTVIAAIDQLVCNDVIRVAEHRCYISPEFQMETFEVAKKIWQISHSDHFFVNMTKEQSQERCAQLDKIKDVFADERVKALYGRS